MITVHLVSLADQSTSIGEFACACRVFDDDALLTVDMCFYLDWMMIYSNRNPRRKLRIHLVRNGK